MERELPVINIEGTDFIVDVNNVELREKANQENKISFFDMREVGNGYELDFNPINKNLSGVFHNIKFITICIPEMVKLDPVGVAKKYNCRLEDLKDKTDFDLMVDQVAFDNRISGQLPTIDIAGHTFYVDLRIDMLRPKDDFLSKGIVFDKISDYYYEDNRTYTIPYNSKTHEFQEIDYQTIKEFPKDLIAVKIPSERIFDRVGWNRKYGFNVTHGLKQVGLKLHFKSKIIPWEKTILPQIIESNLQKKQEQKANRDTNRIPIKKQNRKGHKRQ